MTETATDNKIGFKLVSPARILMDAPAYQVSVPGEEGDLGVLKGHAPFVVTVRPGVVSITKEQGGEIEKIFIAGGFADISAENCTILAEEATPLSELSQEAIEQDIANLTEDLGMAQGDHDKARIEAAISLAKAKLSAVSGTLHL